MNFGITLITLHMQRKKERTSRTYKLTNTFLTAPQTLFSPSQFGAPPTCVCCRAESTAFVFCMIPGPVDQDVPSLLHNFLLGDWSLMSLSDAVSE